MPRLRIVLPVIAAIIAMFGWLFIAQAQTAKYNNRVQTITGSGVPGATITVCLPSGSQTPCGSPILTATADAAGNYNVAPAPGTYDIFVSANGFATFKYTQTISPDIAGNNSWTGNESHLGAESFTGSVPQLFVSTSGNDNNSCLSGFPCLTVQHTCQVALSYIAAGSSVTVNVGTGSFAGFQLAGFNSGNGGPGLNNLLLINGNGQANTTLTAFGSTNIVATASSGLQIELENITLSATGSTQYDIFAQNPGTIVTLGPSVTLAGASSAAAAMHVEAGAYIQSSGNPTTTFSGSFTVPITAGPGGFVQLGNTLACSSLTFSQEFTLVDAAQFNMFATTSFSGCGAVTGIRYYVRGNGLLSNLSASSLPGNSIGLVDSGGRYRPSPTPTIASATGLGTGGTAAFLAGTVAGSHGGIIVLNTGSASTAASGTVTINWAEDQVSGGSAASPCTSNVQTGASAWTAPSSVTIAGDTLTSLFLTWNNTGALSTGTNYQISYTCNGDI